MNKQSHFPVRASSQSASRSHLRAALGGLALILLGGCVSSDYMHDSTLASAAGSNSQHDNRQSASSTPDKQAILDLFYVSRELVAEQTKADLSHIRLLFASDQEISEEVFTETEKLVKEQFSNRRFASHFLEAVMTSQSGTYAALFATQRAQVMLSSSLFDHYMAGLPRDMEIRRSAIQALLIHELVHAADDVNYGIHENRALNFRASFAQSATFEGHAQWLTRKICTQNGCLEGLKALDNFMFSRDITGNQLTQPVQAVSRNVLEYSYIEGENFLQKLAARPNGELLIEQLLTNPPHDPIQILDPASYPNIKREKRNQRLLDAAADVNHAWREQPWTMVETSPLKGVNLRAEPGKRAAAIEGFTRLITSMVAAQLYDQSAPGQTPIEITLMQTDNKNTATLFAETLHQNNLTPATQITNYTAAINERVGKPKVFILLSSEDTEDLGTYFSAVASLDEFVIQVSGFGTKGTDFVEYAIATLGKLHYQAQASL